MTITTILLAVFGALLVAAYALWDLGADQLIAGFGRLVIRTLTFGRVRIAANGEPSFTQLSISSIRRSAARRSRWRKPIRL
jgi:hypothetical protein